MTKIIHTNTNYRNVGMIEVLNEPISGQASLVSEYYPTAWKRIRAAEDKLSITTNNRLHIQMMDQDWGAGNPNQALTDLTFSAYDDHRYIKWANVGSTRANYLQASCQDNRDSNTPNIVGEWSLSVADNLQDTADFDKTAQLAFYKQWWAAQVMAYEKQSGWIFWSWKTTLDDYRWSYKGKFLEP
jgi:glucan endo-1,6-beta-glucosidase